MVMGTTPTPVSVGKTGGVDHRNPRGLDTPSPQPTIRRAPAAGAVDTPNVQARGAGRSRQPAPWEAAVALFLAEKSNVASPRTLDTYRTILLGLRVNVMRARAGIEVVGDVRYDEIVALGAELRTAGHHSARARAPGRSSSTAPTRRSRPGGRG
jgi:hypothetical protein